jgi:hypothetical protein
MKGNIAMIKPLRPATDSPLMRAVAETFTQMGWNSRRVPVGEVLEADFELHHTRARIVAQVFAEYNTLCVQGHLSHRVPDSRSGLVAEVLMRTNKLLTLGAFELDYDGGHLLYRVTNVFPDGGAHRDIIASLVHTTLAEIDRLTPFIALILSMSAEALGTLNVVTFLQREDLLPPVPESPT